MRIDERLLEIKEYTGEGYMPVVDYETWRVAILNYCQELLPENITKMQKHDESDEVFVVLKGEFILYIGEGKDKIDNIYAQRLEPLKMYNVKKGVWHTHTLSKDAMVLIVENKNTDLSNSPEINLNSEQRSKLIICDLKL
jgi:mannose-6-phosphate isomerase-like protein (cupin superfamily)